MEILYNKKRNIKSYIITIVLLLLSLQLFSCSTSMYRYFYNSFDSFMVRKIDSYFDVNSKQTVFLSQKLQHFQKWHRKNELKDFNIMLKGLRGGVKKKLTRADIKKVMNTIENKFQLYSSFLADNIIQFLTTIDKDQIKYFQNELYEELEEWKEKSDIPLHEKIEKRTESVLKILEYFYGDFTENQRIMIASKTAHIKDIIPIKLKFRKERNKNLIILLNGNRKNVKFKKKLRFWMVNIEESRPAYYKNALRRINNQYADIFLFADNKLVSKNQRKHAMEKIDDLIKIVDDLQKQ